jgi:hypothetical protein
MPLGQYHVASALLTARFDFTPYCFVADEASGLGYFLGSFGLKPALTALLGKWALITWVSFVVS